MEAQINNIKAVLKEKGITQKEFAKQVGVAPSVLSRVLNHKQPASKWLLCRMLYATGLITYNDIISDSDTEFSLLLKQHYPCFSFNKLSKQLKINLPSLAELIYNKDATPTPVTLRKVRDHFGLTTEEVVKMFPSILRTSDITNKMITKLGLLYSVYELVKQQKSLTYATVQNVLHGRLVNETARWKVVKLFGWPQQAEFYDLLLGDIQRRVHTWR